MASFQFRLKTLLKLREATRDECRAHLAEAYVAERALAARRTALEQDVDAQRDLFRTGAAPGRIDVDRLLTANRYELVLRSEIAVLTQHAQALAIEIERRRQTAIAADREVRVLEKLRDRQLDIHRQTQATADTKALDEVAARMIRDEEIP